jgi:hypothetical protein
VALATDDDLAAYEWLRGEGLQPKRTAGSARLAQALRADRIRYHRSLIDEQKFIDGNPPAPLQSKDLGIHVVLLPDGPDEDEIAGFVWAHRGWVISGTVAMTLGKWMIRNLQIGPLPTLEGDDGVSRPRTDFVGAAITSSLLRDVRPDQILSDIRETIRLAADEGAWDQWLRAHGVNPINASELAALAKKAERRIAKTTLQRGRRGYGDDFYRQIARICLSTWNQYPASRPRGINRAIRDRITELLGPFSEATIRSWIHEARKREFLAPTSPGKADFTPGPRLEMESKMGANPWTAQARRLVSHTKED